MNSNFDYSIYSKYNDDDDYFDVIQDGGREESYDIRNYDDGVYRKKINNHFKYFYIKNNELVPESHETRINKLRIPPAWIDVWISADRDSKIQAVGIDVKKRKQYRYHTTYTELAEKRKFIRMYDFIKALPKLEENMKLHEKLDAYDRNHVICTMLKIIKITYMRVGKEQYVRENKSYGIASLKKSHIKIHDEQVTFNFKGKSNQKLNYVVKDPDIIEHLKLLLKLSSDNNKLFNYKDENNKIKKLTYSDMNEYIQEYMGKEFTAKDFRTYAANYNFIDALLFETRKKNPDTDLIKKKNLSNALEKTAKFLKHTKNISKKSYVMNFIIEYYMSNTNYFIKHKYDKIDNILLELLRYYKKSLKT